MEGLPTQQIILNNSSGQRIGELSGIVISALQKGDSGRGYSDENAITLTWLVVG